MKTHLLKVVFFLIAFNLNGQNSNDVFIDQQIKQADSLSALARYEEAINIFNEVSRVYKENENWEGYFRTETKILENLGKRFLLDETIKRGLATLGESEELFGIQNQYKAEIQMHLARNYLTKSLYEDALNSYEEALEFFENNGSEYDKQRAGVLYGLGIYYFQRGDVKRSIALFESCLELRTKLYGKESVLVADLYHALGYALTESKIYDRALTFYNEAMRIYEEINGPDHFLSANTVNGIGLVYERQKQFSSAIEYFQRARKIGFKYFGETHWHVANAHMNLGRVYTNKNDLERALDHTGKALNIFIKVFGEVHQAVAYGHSSLGNIHLELEEYELSIAEYLKSIEILKTIFPSGKAFHLAEAYNSLGHIYQKSGQPQKSLISFDRSIAANVVSADSTINRDFKNRDFHILGILIKSLWGKAEINHTLYLINREEKHLKESLEAMTLCDELIKRSRMIARSDADKLNQNQLGIEIYKNMTSMYKDFYETTKDEELLKRMFYSSQNSKSASLRDKWQEQGAKNVSLIPDSLLKYENQLKADIIFYQSAVNDAISKNTDNSDEGLVENKRKLFDLKIAYDKLILKFENEFPEYFNLKYSSDYLTISSIQKSLGSSSFLIDFLVNDDQTFLFIIQKEKYHVEKIDIRKDSLNALIDSFHESIANQEETTYLLSNSIFDILLSKVKNQFSDKRLIIIPDGPLWKLNFEILLTDKPSENLIPKELPYLIKSNAITYDYSVWSHFNVQESNVLKELNCLAFSYGTDQNFESIEPKNFFSLRSLSKSDLPGSRKEILQISKLMEGSYFFGESANEDNFKKNASDFNVIHLALHGEFDENDPLNSRLIFNSDDQSNEDNYLYAHELYGLTLNVKMAVLSACNSGSGKITEGEGIIGMGRAFSYAGCKSLIVSQWELADNISARLMSYFYQMLLDGNTKSDALRKAKLNILESDDPIISHPYYWAPLVHFGNDREIVQKWPLKPIFIATIVSITFLIGIIFFKRYRTTS